MNERSYKGWAIVRSRLGTLILSLLLALMVWIYASALENPLVLEDFSERIPLVVRGLDPALQSVQPLDRESVTVKVRAPRKSWDDLSVSDFFAYIDLSGLTVGSHTAPVQVDVSDPQVRIVEVRQPSLRLQLDVLKSKLVPVQLMMLDGVAYGYEWKTPIIDPVSVTVSGPATLVDLVTEANVGIYLQNAKQQVEKRLLLQPVNRQNQIVNGVQLAPNEANIIVPVERWPGLKEVAVRLTLVGEPALGYRLITMNVFPSTVVLEGASSLISAVPGFIATMPMTITGATSEIRQRLGLVVPPGLSVATIDEEGNGVAGEDPNSVTATVNIAPLEDSRTLRLRPVVQNIGQGLEAKIAIDTVDAIVSGPVPLLAGLNPDDAYAVLDLSGLVSGSHSLRPRLILPEGLRSESILPETVEVVLTDLQNSSEASQEITSTNSTTISSTQPISETLPSPP
jgi:YbbR domain-containing protein